MIRRLLHNNHKLDLTQGSIIRNVWVLACPMMVANILQTAFNVVDMIWVGRLGTEAIAGVAMSGVVLMVIITLVIGVSTGTQSLIARFIGAKNQANAENVAMQSLIIGAFLSIILAVVGLIFARPILHALGAKTTIRCAGTLERRAWRYTPAPPISGGKCSANATRRIANFLPQIIQSCYCQPQKP